MKVSRKIDKFYAVLAGVLLLLSAPLIYTALGIFSAINTANEIDLSVQGDAIIDSARLELAVREAYDKNVPDLLVRETSISLLDIDTNEQ